MVCGGRFNKRCHSDKFSSDHLTNSHNDDQITPRKRLTNIRFVTEVAVVALFTRFPEL